MKAPTPLKLLPVLFLWATANRAMASGSGSDLPVITNPVGTSSNSGGAANPAGLSIPASSSPPLGLPADHAVSPAPSSTTTRPEHGSGC